MKILNIADKFIELSFYAIFFLVPLVFWKETSELFEFNKMWLTFLLTILIAFAWVTKMIIMKKFWIQKTPLDIPIALFLSSQIIATIFSLDSYVSFFGYYSRFNGGLLSIFSYVLLYYAFVSNFDLKTKAVGIVKRLLGVSLVSAALVALWGLPSHFGYDPTCLLFRGSLDVSCWTKDFLPQIRIFSTLGQPAWLGAYLAVLSPIALAFALQFQISRKYLLITIYYLLPLLFYVDILFTKSRAALIAFWISQALFLVSYYYLIIKPKIKTLGILPLFFGALLVVSAVILFPSPSNKVFERTGTFSSGGGGTESGQIRLLVWQGALKIWKNYPIFGSGVETFAYSYYKYKPVEHNLTSEWNYLYNKAHNEYLNFLATTGIFGLGSYLIMIGTFLWIVAKKVISNTTNVKYYQYSNIGNLKLVIIGIISAYISILITNFFGFSVVIVNLYLFLIPALVFVLLGTLNEKKALVYDFSPRSGITDHMTFLQKLDIFISLIVAFYLLIGLVNFWLADQAYALGSNLNRSGQYDRAYFSLQEATSRVSFEPQFRDELASNNSVLAISLLSSLSEDGKKASEEAQLAQSLAREAIISTSQLTSEHSNNIVFWKTRVRIFYALSQVDQKYTKFALEAIKKALELSPTDAHLTYNLALLYGQSENSEKAIETLKKTIELKPNYRDAHYALGLFYRQLATNDKGQVIDTELEEKAIQQMGYILKKIDPNDEEAKSALKLWQK